MIHHHRWCWNWPLAASLHSCARLIMFRYTRRKIETSLAATAWLMLSFSSCTIRFTLCRMVGHREFWFGNMWKKNGRTTFWSKAHYSPLNFLDVFRLTTAKLRMAIFQARNLPIRSETTKFLGSADTYDMVCDWPCGQDKNMPAVNGNDRHKCFNRYCSLHHWRKS
jgi:hypothetical protein